MDARTSPEVVQFEQFRLDRRVSRLLRRTDGGEVEPVSLGSRAIAILCTLVEHGGDLVSKDEIMAAVWPNTVVEESNLTVQISALRRVLDRGRRGASCIQTVAGRGYRFVPMIVRLDEVPPEPRMEAQFGQHERRPTGKLAVVMAGVVALAALLGTGGWWMLYGRAATGATHSQDRRLSVAILPFANSGGDAASENFAAELTQRLTALLGRTPDGPVILGTRAEAHRGKPLDLRAIGRDRDVHFVLAGNTRQREGHLIVSAIIYETADGTAVGSRQFDVPDGPGALTTVAQVIYEDYWKKSVDLEAGYAERDHPDRLDARDLILIALSTRLATTTRANHQEKLSLIERALALDPNNFQALERQARLRAASVLLGYSADPAADLAIAARAADHALAIDPNSLISLRAKATILRAEGDWTAAEAILRRVLMLQPTEANRHHELGQTLMAEGRFREALASFQTARGFAGGDDPVYAYDANIAVAYLALDQFADAIAAARLAMGEMPPDTGWVGELAWLALIAATDASGDDETARADLHRFLSAPRNWHSIAEVQKWPAFATIAPLLDGLRRAGMPAE